MAFPNANVATDHVGSVAPDQCTYNCLLTLWDDFVLWGAPQNDPCLNEL